MQAAAVALDIRFVRRFAFELHGVRYISVGHLPEFGGPNGMLLWSLRRPAPKGVEPFGLSREAGFYASGLSLHYETWRRPLFVDALDDWGWYGARDRAPVWFTGHRYR